MANENNNEAIGFHKGAINTLVNERNELIRIVQVTETLVQAHIKALEELGVKLETKNSISESEK